jgi:DNA-directed RNA polymerase subunit L
MAQNSINMNSVSAAATFDLKRVSVSPNITYASLPSALQVSWTLLQQSGINVQAKHLAGVGKVIYLAGLTEAQVMDIYLVSPNSSLSQSTCLLSIGVYTNNEIVDTACKILIINLRELDAIIERDELEIKNSDSTMANCFDVILENQDYTLGNVIEYFLFSKFFETNMITYCGFKKMHPHDNYSIIRLAYKQPVEKSTIKGHLKECIADAIHVYNRLKKEFTRFVKN